MTGVFSRVLLRSGRRFKKRQEAYWLKSRVWTLLSPVTTSMPDVFTFPATIAHHFSCVNLAVSKVRSGSSRVPSLDSIHLRSPLTRAVCSSGVSE